MNDINLCRDNKKNKCALLPPKLLLMISFFSLLVSLTSSIYYWTGQLRVYVKVESQKLEDVGASFIRSGDQGHQWRQGYIPLSNITENFQVNQSILS